jgi:alpha/beta superfamily hydrolase
VNGSPARPLYFGADDQRLFGWLHRPALQAPCDLALVLCNPFGFEEVCAHRALRDMARAAADAGIPALRFDYPDSGQSSDVGPAGADLWPLWVDSVHQAIDAVREATGARRVALLGVRLGALLAAAAAQGRDDVHGLVLVAPVVRGRSYLRELALLGATGAGPATAAAADDGIESAGFAMSGATCRSLSAVDLKTLDLPAALRVRVVERDDVPDPTDVAAALARAGVDARSERWPGYAAMAADPQRAVTPPAIVAGVLAALGEWRRETARPAEAQAENRAFTSPTLESGAGSAWVETPVTIDTGDGGHLFAIVCCPLRPAAPGPAVLMLNAGAVHAAGPNRLWVRLARRWAGHGVTTLRLDLSGIGDSPPRQGESDNVVYSASAMADVAAALQWLRSHEGATACHVMGLCSGAYHSFRAATTGLPVASALMINPLTYFWVPGTPLSDLKDYEVLVAGERYRSGLFRLQTWQRLARGELDLRQIATTAVQALARGASRRWRDAARAVGLPLADDLAGDLLSAARARRPLRFVFATDAPGCTLLHRQGGPVVQRLAREGSLSLDFVDGADHTFTRAPVRESLVQRLDRLMLDACGVGPAA